MYSLDTNRWTMVQTSADTAISQGVQILSSSTVILWAHPSMFFEYLWITSTLIVTYQWEVRDVLDCAHVHCTCIYKRVEESSHKGTCMKIWQFKWHIPLNNCFLQKRYSSRNLEQALCGSNCKSTHPAVLINVLHVFQMKV